MRNVILQEFVSVDALAAGPNGSVDFVPAATGGDESFGKAQMELINSVDTMLLGRVTYQLFAGYWPNVNDGPEKEFADKFNAMPKIVFSKTLENAPWGKWQPAAIGRTGASDEVAKLKRESGKDIVIFGSISLVQNLMAEGLIDRYRLVVCPIVLGSGRSLFAEKQDLKLTSAKSFERGAVLLQYSLAPA